MSGYSSSGNGYGLPHPVAYLPNPASGGRAAVAVLAVLDRDLVLVREQVQQHRFAERLQLRHLVDGLEYAVAPTTENEAENQQSQHRADQRFPVLANMHYQDPDGQDDGCD